MRRVLLRGILEARMVEKHPMIKKNGSPQFGGARKNGNGKHGKKVWEFGFHLNLKNIFIGQVYLQKSL